MDNNQSKNMDIRTETATAVSRAEVSYGYANGITITRPRAYDTAVSLSFSSQISYLFTEYFKGILFVLFCAVFIFAVPTFITKPASVRLMLGRILKRTIDIIGAVAGLILTLPIWVILPIIIKLDSKGSVFYTQSRVGINRRKKDRRYHQKVDIEDHRGRERRRENHSGEPFKLIKFRTMVQNAEKKTGPVWATKNDARITRVGALLRKSRIDEIPQFINVLKGDMSLVGPRPERPSFVKNLTEKVENYSERLKVKPGITGLAQVKGEYDSSISTVTEKIKYDLEYINNWSLWMDIKILFKTVLVVITGKGAN